ncbi:MAG: hypothetical protein QW815_00370, partial [Nitrososphaerota archaeon]
KGQKRRKKDEGKEGKEIVTETSPTVSEGQEISIKDIIEDIKRIWGNFEQFSKAFNELEILITHLLESWIWLATLAKISPDSNNETYQQWSSISDDISLLENLLKGTKNSFIQLRSKMTKFINSLSSTQSSTQQES